MEPSGGTDMVENLEKVVSLRGALGRVGEDMGSPKFATEGVLSGWAMVVGSVLPFSWIEGTSSADAMMISLWHASAH